MREVYGERRAQVVKDPEWLKLVGDSEWIALMKDKHIRYRQAEIAALVKYRVRAFCLVRGGLTADQQNETFLRHQQQIFDASVAPGPFLYAVSATQVRRVDLE
jgi:hypothetical protein